MNKKKEDKEFKENNKKEKKTQVVQKNEDQEKEEVKNERRPFFSYIIILMLLLSLVYLYARYIGVKGMEVRTYNITNENIPESFDGFSIVQFSDLELETTFSLEDIENMVEKINKLDPDIVVFTGDLAKSYYSPSSEDKRVLIEALSKIDALIGKYSIRGDDDFEGSLYDEVLSNAGFNDLTNTYELIYYKGLVPIVLYGLGSLINENQNFEATFSYPAQDEDTTYMASYRILLAHEPDTILNVGEYNISLMLSGHSHNSEINVPYLKNYYNIKGASSYFDRKYKVSGTELYISSGLGTSKYKMRMFSRPSISIYRLYTD